MQLNLLSIPPLQSICAALFICLGLSVALDPAVSEGGTADEYHPLQYRDIGAGYRADDPEIRLLVATAYLQDKVNFECSSPSLGQSILEQLVLESESRTPNSSVLAEAHWQLSQLTGNNRKDHEQLAAQHGHVEAAYQLWREAFYSREPPDSNVSEAFSRLVESTTRVQHSVAVGQAHLEIGLAYMQGLVVDRDLPLGFRYLRKAASAGNAPALEYLLRLEGFGISEETNLSEYMSERSARATSHSAEDQYIMGRLLVDGILFPMDGDKSLNLIQAAASQDYPDAVATLARRSYYQNIQKDLPASTDRQAYFLHALDLRQLDALFDRYNRVLEPVQRFLEADTERERDRWNTNLIANLKRSNPDTCSVEVSTLSDTAPISANWNEGGASLARDCGLPF